MLGLFFCSGFPCLAVAAGFTVYLYRHGKPYRRFNLPPAEPTAEEQEIWTGLVDGQLDADEARNRLRELQ